jgi:hypothetical protein
MYMFVFALRSTKPDKPLVEEDGQRCWYEAVCDIGDKDDTCHDDKC